MYCYFFIVVSNSLLLSLKQLLYMCRGRPLLQQRKGGAAGAQGRSKHLPFAYRQVAHRGQAGQADHYDPAHFLSIHC